MRITDESLRGRTVVAADGLALGEIAALFINSDTWTVESLQVKLRKGVAEQVGAAKSIFRAETLEIPAHKVQSVGDAVVLSVTARELRAALPGEDEGKAGH